MLEQSFASQGRRPSLGSECGSECSEGWHGARVGVGGSLYGMPTEGGRGGFRSTGSPGRNRVRLAMEARGEPGSPSGCVSGSEQNAGGLAFGFGGGGGKKPHRNHSTRPKSRAKRRSGPGVTRHARRDRVRPLQACPRIPTQSFPAPKRTGRSAARAHGDLASRASVFGCNQKAGSESRPIVIKLWPRPISERVRPSLARFRSLTRFELALARIRVKLCQPRPNLSRVRPDSSRGQLELSRTLHHGGGDETICGNDKLASTCTGALDLPRRPGSMVASKLPRCARTQLHESRN